MQSLCICVGADKLHALHLIIDHMVHGVSASTTNAYNFNFSALRDALD
jgi:hypothetical protein